MTDATHQETIETQALTAWADDEYVVAQQLLTLTGLYGPEIEESVAIGSIAQDHLGHAINLYRQVESDDRAIDRLVFERGYHEFQACDLTTAWEKDDWCWIVARHAVYDLANHHRARWAEQAWPRAAGLSRMIQRESSLHLEHWWEWLDVTSRNRQLAPGTHQAVKAIIKLTPSFFLLDNNYCPWGETRPAFEHELERRLVRAGLDASLRASSGSQLRRRSDDKQISALLGAAHAEYLSAPQWNWGTT